jgi:hypothetical protein
LSAKRNGIGGNRLRFRRARFVLNFSGVVLLGVALMRRTGWAPSIVPKGHDQTFYLVVNNYGQSGAAFAETDVGEADLETVISDLVRVVAFNSVDHWSEDASEDIAREILRRLDLAGDALPSSITVFVDSHLGPDRQLTLRLA